MSTKLLSAQMSPQMSVIRFPEKPKNAPPLNFRMEKKSATSADIFVYDIIGGWGISAQSFVKDLKALGNVKSINLHVNSDGGDVFDGRAIFSNLVNHPAKITTYVDGLAASIASLIALAGNPIIMADGSFMMIHNAWGMAVGNATEIRKFADLLDSTSKTIADTYAAKTGLSNEDIAAMMQEETWMNAQEAVDKGFATSVGPSLKMAAAVRHREFFAKMPPKELLPTRQKAEAAILRGRAALEG